MMRRLRLALAFLPAVALLPGAAAAAPPTKLTKGPYITSFGETTADIRFELDAPGPAVLEIAGIRGSSPARKFPDATVTANHLVHVTGLEPSKTYVYGVLLGTQPVARGELTAATSTHDGTPIKFILYGDDRSDPSAHEAIARALVATPSQFLVNTGDVVEDGGNASDWQTFFSLEATLLRDRPLFLCIGNHELYDDESGANFARYFGFSDGAGPLKPYGTIRVGPARFFFLNGMHDWSSGEERAWLERELTRADGEALQWRVAVVHHSPWSSGPHGPNKTLVAAHVPELLAAHKIDLLFAGHDHIYERGDAGTMKYMISGGGGAPLYRVTQPTAMTKKAEAAYHYVEVTMSQVDVRTVAHRLDGSVLEKCGFLKGGSWDCDPVNPSPAPASPPAGASPSSGAAPAPTSATPGSTSRCSVTAAGLGAAAAPGAAGTAQALGGLAALGGLGLAAALRRRRRRG